MQYVLNALMPPSIYILYLMLSLCSSSNEPIAAYAGIVIRTNKLLTHVVILFTSQRLEEMNQQGSKLHIQKQKVFINSERLIVTKAGSGIKRYEYILQLYFRHDMDIQKYIEITNIKYFSDIGINLDDIFDAW